MALEVGDLTFVKSGVTVMVTAARWTGHREP